MSPVGSLKFNIELPRVSGGLIGVEYWATEGLRWAEYSSTKGLGWAH